MLTHLTPEGNPSMVDVGAKLVSKRTAKARSVVTLGAAILGHLEAGDIQTRKGVSV